MKPYAITKTLEWRKDNPNRRRLRGRRRVGDTGNKTAARVRAKAELRADGEAL